MYLTVYILKSSGYTVIPDKWLKNVLSQEEKFFNNGMNSNQVHVCFWTDKLSARNSDGSISLNYAPNFDATFHNDFPNEGLYFCKVIRAKGK